MNSQLAFGLLNSADDETVENVIYVTPDSAYNRVALQISLTSGSTMLAPGKVPDPDDPPAPGTGTTIYLDLSQLGLPAAAWDQLTFDGGAWDWEFKTFPALGVVGMTPSGAPIPLSAGTAGSLLITVNGITIPVAPDVPQVQLYAAYYNVPDVDGTYSTFAVAIQNAPDQQADLATAISVSLSENGIVNSVAPLPDTANEFALELTGLRKTVKAGPDTRFSVTFVYGRPSDPYGYGALTSVASAIRFAVTAGDNAEDWVIKPDTQAQAVTWTLEPPSGRPIVGTGPRSVVTVNFANVITTYQPGPTTVLVSATGVPGYRDTTYVVLMEKIEHVSITALDVSPNPTYFSNGTAKVTVSWRTGGTPRRLELTQNYKPSLVTGKTQVPAVLDAEVTTFSLKATGRTGAADNADYATVQAIALPVINSFTGAPTEIYCGAQLHDADFAWAVDSTDDVTLTSTGDAFNGESYNPTDRATASISEPQLITLAPTTAAEPLTLTRKLLISAFRATPRSYPLPFTPAAVIAAPSGPYLLAAGPEDSLTVIDTVKYAPVEPFGLGHAAAALAFSADGGTLATANTDQTVSVVGVTAGPGGMPSFGTPATIGLPGAPQQLVFSPGADRIFVTVDLGAAPGQLVSLLRTAGGYEVENLPVPVGRGPRGLTLDAAGSRVFVANSADKTVSMVGLDRDGKPLSETTITGFPGACTGIAATPSGKQLLVSCTGANGGAGTVIAIDPNRPDTGRRVTLNVGRSPGAIGLLPGGAYAAVANGGDGTLSLISCWGRVANAGLAGQPLAVGSQPGAVTASPDGLQVFAATGGGFSVVTLTSYEVSARAPLAPNNPTSVVASPDGTNVFFWHNAQLPAPSASPGILVYQPGSRTTLSLLGDKDVISFVVSPNPRVGEGFAIADGDQRLYQVDIARLEPSVIPLGLADDAVPVALAIAGGGQTLALVAADASRKLSLIVLKRVNGIWAKAQSLALPEAKGRVLLRFVPDGSTLFLVDVAGATVRVLRRSGAAYALSPVTIPGDVKASDLTVLPDGLTAYVLNAGKNVNTITVIDVASLRANVVAMSQVNVNLTALAASPDGRRLFATDTNAAALRVLDPRSLRITQTIPLTERMGAVAGVLGLAVLEDGSAVYTANMDTQNLSVVEQVQMNQSPAEIPAERTGRRLTTAGQYQGLFLRHYLGEKPGYPPNGWSASPDIFPYGQAIEPDLSKFTSPEGYARDWGTTVETGGNPNYVYVRGLNPTQAKLTSRAYFYYTKGSLAMWPAEWTADNITLNSEPVNWIDIEAEPGAVAAGKSPFLWTPDDLPASDHYCMIGWVVDGPNPQPPDFPAYRKFQTMDDLIRFIQSHSNMGWRNVVTVAKPPPNYRYDNLVPLKGGGGTVYISVNFVDVPDNGEFAVFLQGTEEFNTVRLDRTSISGYRGGYWPPNNPLPFPADFQGSLQVWYWAEKNTPPPLGSKIRVNMFAAVTASLLRDIERAYRPRGLLTPVRTINDVPVFTVGTVEYDLRFGNKANGTETP